MIKPRHTTPAPTAPRPPIYRDFVLIQLAALAFLLDQFTKYLVRASLDLYQSFPTEGFFRITHTFNTGSIFGIFQGQNTAFILVSFLGIAVLLILYRSHRFPPGLLRLSLGLQLGGAFGNLLDRLRLGHVTDWVDLGPWPVFNIADACIVTGLILLAYLFIISETRRPAPTPADTPVDAIDTVAPIDAVAPTADAAPTDAVAPIDTALTDTANAPNAPNAPNPNPYDHCPICEGEMRPLPPANGRPTANWRCTTCGARERQLPNNPAP